MYIIFLVIQIFFPVWAGGLCDDLTWQRVGGSGRLLEEPEEHLHVQMYVGGYCGVTADASMVSSWDHKTHT